MKLDLSPIIWRGDTDGNVTVSDALQSAYVAGREDARLDLRTWARAGHVPRTSVMVRVAEADDLARAYSPVSEERAAYSRGFADALAERVEMPLEARELAGCVVTCAECRGVGACPTPPDELLVCSMCGGAGLVYSAELLAAVEARHG